MNPGPGVFPSNPIELEFTAVNLWSFSQDYLLPWGVKRKI